MSEWLTKTLTLNTGAMVPIVGKPSTSRRRLWQVLMRTQALGHSPAETLLNRLKQLLGSSPPCKQVTDILTQHGFMEQRSLLEMQSRLLVFLVKNFSLPRSFRESVRSTTSLRTILASIGSWNHTKRVQWSIDQSLKNTGL